MAYATVAMTLAGDFSGVSSDVQKGDGKLVEFRMPFSSWSR
jgi:hypothetical protein